MSSRFLVSLAAVVALILGARFILASLPLRGLARPLTVNDAVFTGVGLAGLAFHCGAMFFSSTLVALPGTDAAIADIRALGTASFIWYLIPGAFVLVGLRRQHPAALTMAAPALTAVGITMYNDGPVRAHLAAIYASVVVIAVIAATAVLPPWGHRSAPA